VCSGKQVQRTGGRKKWEEKIKERDKKGEGQYGEQ